MSFAQKTEKLVQELIQAEYKNACEKFGETYHSLHEGYAVLLEEVEEVEQEKKLLDINIASIWYRIKQNELNEDDIKQALNHMMYTMQELAQVGAVFIKMQNTLEKKSEENA